MNYVRLTPEQQRAVCENLLAIEQAGQMQLLAAVRLRMLREHRGACAWEQVAIDHLTKQASRLIGGSRGYWREAAASALGIPSEVEVSAEAVFRVAEEIRWQEPEPAEPQRPTSRPRFTLGSRKRGSR